MIPKESVALVTAAVFYTSVFLIAQLLRWILDKTISKKSWFHRFCLEVIGTATICICVFENGIIIVNYGIGAFFIVNTILGFLFGALGRNAFGNPMAPIEKFLYGEMSLFLFIVVVIAEVIGGMFSFSITKELWKQSLAFTDTHLDFYISAHKECTLNYQKPLWMMQLFEITGAFAMRMVFPRIPAKVASWVIPALVSCIFSFSISFMGDAAIDPIVGSSLFFGCRGLDLQLFMLQYWICPTLGWLTAAYLDRQLTSKHSKKVTTNNNGQEKKKREKSFRGKKQKQQ